MSIINKPSANRPSLNQPAVNRINQPVQANTSFFEAAANKINNTLNNATKAVNQTINQTINKPINASLNAESNAGENSESVTYIVVVLGFLILTLIIVIYFRAQITAGFNMAWIKAKELFARVRGKGGDTSATPMQYKPESEPQQPPHHQPIPEDKPVHAGLVGTELSGIKTIKNSIQSNVNKLIPKKKEVFNIAQDVYTYADAEPLCKAYGAELATYDQVKEAWKKGADWCNYGWVKGQTAVYPTQKETYDKLQAGPESQRGSCGVPGVNGGYFDNPDLRFGVNCYGERPDSNEADERYKAANRQNNTPEGMAYDKKVRNFKAHLNEIPINPFDAGSMAM